MTTGKEDMLLGLTPGLELNNDADQKAATPNAIVDLVLQLKTVDELLPVLDRYAPGPVYDAAMQALIALARKGERR